MFKEVYRELIQNQMLTGSSYFSLLGPNFEPDDYPFLLINGTEVVENTEENHKKHRATFTKLYTTESAEPLTTEEAEKFMRNQAFDQWMKAELSDKKELS